MIGNEEDFTACLGCTSKAPTGISVELNTASFRSMIEQAVAEFPNLKVVATTLRTVKSATVNDWGAIAWSRDGGFVEATPPTRRWRSSTASAAATASRRASSTD